MTSRKSATRAALALSLIGAAALSACGGGGSDSGPPVNGVQPIVVNQLFLEDGHTGQIAAFPDAKPTSGTTFSNHVVAAVSGATGAMAYDAVHDQLYVAVAPTSSSPAAIEVFTNASTMTAGKPARTITPDGGIPAFSLITKLAIDTSTDTLWVYGRNQAGLLALTNGSLMAIAHASTTSGSVPAGGAVGVRSGGSETFFAYDGTRDVAYLTGRVDNAGNDIPGIAVFDAASTTYSTSGLQTPTSTIAIDGATDIAVDAAHDALYVADPTQGLWIVRQASTGSPVVVGPLAMAGVTSVSLDSASDRLVVGAGGSAYVFDQASSLTAGSPFPAATVVDAGSGSAISSAAFH